MGLQTVGPKKYNQIHEYRFYRFKTRANLQILRLLTRDTDKRITSLVKPLASVSPYVIVVDPFSSFRCWESRLRLIVDL